MYALGIVLVIGLVVGWCIHCGHRSRKIMEQSRMQSRANKRIYRTEDLMEDLEDSK